MAVAEAELMWAQRAFPKAQQLLAATGAPTRRLPGLVDIGWHGTEVEPIAGAVGVIGLGGDQDLLGEVVRVSNGTRSIYVYLLGVRAVPTPYSVSRRAFLGLGLLAIERLACVVEVIA
jgi:hypothetical protein